MPIDPQEDPPIKPGQPSEPPQESPAGNPRPEVPPPMQDPGEPPPPDELPGSTPDELPVRGPEGPAPGPTAAAITRWPAASRIKNPGAIDMPQGTLRNYGLKSSPECAMNDGVRLFRLVGNKNRIGFEGRHITA